MPEPPPFFALWVPNSKADRNDELAILSPGGVRKEAIDGDWRRWLPRSVCDEILARHDSGRSSLLLLDSSLPKEWFGADLEALRIGGKPLSAIATLVRHAQPVFGKPSRLSSQVGYLNLFPKHEFNFNRELGDLVSQQKIAKKFPAWIDADLDALDDLFILAHGDENGLLDTEGRSFAFDAHALPRRVWLLACNVDGAMHRLARELLQRRARTVIAANHETSASEMASMVRRWCNRPSGQSLEDWLVTERAAGGRNGGIETLTLFGEVLIDSSPLAEWNERAWKRYRHPDSRPPRLDRNDAAEFERAVAALGDARLWRSTFDWLLPEAISTAENRDHPQMTRLQQYADEATACPALKHAVAAACYRCGHYDLTAKYAMEGLADVSASALERADLLADVVLTLIDHHLTDAAEHALHACSYHGIEHPALRHEYEQKKLDWRSRIAFRRGNFASAIRHMAHKQAQNTDPTDTRELAWLLYMQAWEDRGQSVTSEAGQCWAGEARDRLESADKTSPGKGNDNPAYLVRALACYAWATRDEAALRALAEWKPCILDGAQQRVDPGPWAFALAYLTLRGSFEADKFDLALSALEDAHYWLEAAGFIALVGDRASDAQREQLERCLARNRERAALIVEHLANLELFATAPARAKLFANPQANPPPM